MKFGGQASAVVHRQRSAGVTAASFNAGAASQAFAYGQQALDQGQRAMDKIRRNQHWTGFGNTGTSKHHGPLKRVMVGSAHPNSIGGKIAKVANGGGGKPAHPGHPAHPTHPTHLAKPTHPGKPTHAGKPGHPGHPGGGTIGKGDPIGGKPTQPGGGHPGRPGGNGLIDGTGGQTFWDFVQAVMRGLVTVGDTVMLVISGIGDLFVQATQPLIDACHRVGRQLPPAPTGDGGVAFEAWLNEHWVIASTGIGIVLAAILGAAIH